MNTTTLFQHWELMSLNCFKSLLSYNNYQPSMTTVFVVVSDYLKNIVTNILSLLVSADIGTKNLGAWLAGFAPVCIPLQVRRRTASLRSFLSTPHFIYLHTLSICQETAEIHCRVWTVICTPRCQQSHQAVTFFKVWESNYLSHSYSI